MKKFGTTAASCISAVTVLIGLVFVLSGCSMSPSGGVQTPTSADSQGMAARPPVIVKVNDLDGATVTVPVGRTVDVVGDEDSYAAWSATLIDPTIATFFPGKADGSATFNPGFETHQIGSSQVTMQNSATGKTLHFTLTVTE